jgi:hypothetical protein
MTTTDHNWVTGEAMLWLDNDEDLYHEARRLVKADMDSVDRPERTTTALKALLRSGVPDSTYGVIEQFADIDWDVVINHIREDIEEGYE